MTDENETTQRTPTAGRAPEPEAPRERRLLRSRSDRMLGGVAGGLAEYFRVDAVIFRIGFAVTILFGGLGIVSYLALLVFVPSEVEGAPGKEPPPRSFGRIALMGAAVILGIAATGILALLAAWAGATGHGVAVAILVILIGALLAAAAFRGGARWLIVPALALAIPLGGIAAADVVFDGSIGHREYRPTTFESVAADGYELGVGQLDVDLRDLPWEDDSVVRIETDQGVGETRIAVPESVCISGSADADLGAIRIAGGETGGVDTVVAPNEGTTVTPRLEIDSHIDMGEVRVLNDDSASLGDRGFHSPRGDGDRDALQAALAEACTPDAPKEAKPAR